MRVTLLMLFVLLGPGWSSYAQVDLAGEWGPRNYNTHVDIGDYTGMPLNEEARLRAMAWHPDQLDLPENLCRPHPIDHGLRVSPSQLRITNEFDPETRRPVGIRLLVSWQEPQQVIYTDGRPHPSPNAPHKWSGYSTGRWDRNTLVYTTTHLKEAYLSRNGVPKSIKSTVTTRVHRYGSLLTVWFFINDPAYLTAPYIRASSFVLDPNQIIPPFPCEMSPDGTIVPAGKVPNFLPGKNEVLPEFATEYGIPLEASLGGEETMYPEYIKKMKTMKVAPRTTTDHYRRAQ
jgi:hypothetical protein